MTINMPQGKKNAVCLTFDFDAMAFFFANKVFSPQAISRGEFDALVGAPRLLKLLDKYEIKSTWFIPGHTVDLWPDLVKSIFDAGHEIANHGYRHEAPLEMDKDEEERVLLKGSEAIERVVGVRPVGYRAPKWEPSANTVGLLEKNGFKYASNGMSSDFHPYYARKGDSFDEQGNFVYGSKSRVLEIPSYWYLGDIIQLENVISYPNRIPVIPSAVEGIWKSEFDYMYNNEPGGVITYGFHPAGVGRAYRTDILERLIQHTLKDDVWFARCDEVANAHQE